MPVSSEPFVQPRKRLGGATGKGWRPGQSGNVGGRPRAAANVQALARVHTEAAIETLVSCLTDPKLKVQAAVALLDRGWGKPAQEIVSQDDAQSLSFLHLTAARAFSAELAAEREAAERQLRKPPVIDGEVADKPAATLIDLWAPATE
jgi:hypothetical protein